MDRRNQGTTLTDRPRAIALVALTALALVIAACGPSGSSDTTTGAATAPTTDEPAATTEAEPTATTEEAAPVTITYTSHQQPDTPSGMAEREVIDAFEEANPGITVNLETIPFEDYLTSLTTQLAGGEGPDIGRVNHSDVVAWARAGFLSPLDDDIASGSLEVSHFLPGIFEIGTFGGQQFTVPLTTDTRVLHYNPELFEAAGLVDENGEALPPETWAELKEYALQLTQGDVYGFAFRQHLDLTMLYDGIGVWMIQAGGAVLEESGGTVSAVAGQDENTIAAVQFVQDLVASGLTPPGQRGMTHETTVALMLQDQLAMITGGPWVREAMLDVNPDIEYGVDFATAPVPTREAGGQPGSTAGGWQVGIFAGTENREAALKLLQFLGEEENLISINVQEGFPPIEGGMSAEPWGSDPYYAAYADTLPGAKVPMLPVPQFQEIGARFEVYTVGAVIDGLDAEEQLRAFDEEVNEQLLNP